MMIEIRGVGFVNKGAELMLYAILTKVRERFPAAQFTVAPRYDIVPYEKLARMGLYPKLWLKRYKVQWGYLGNIIPAGLRKMYGLVCDSEVDAVLDASGFAYGDQFGITPTVNLAKAATAWRKQGTKLILMPQAFGPFTNASIRRAFNTVIDCADLICARDKVSHGYVTGLVGSQAKIDLYPDFTNLLDGSPDSEDRRLSRRICIVPNHQMIAKTSPEEGKLYSDLIAKCLRYLLSAGHSPFFLVHESKKDIKLIKATVEKMGTMVEIVEAEDALRIKGILGGCLATIGSRFHGLVSALSQGIPSLAIGWSHKYRMLLEDYGFPEGLISVQDPDETVFSKIDLLIDSDSNSRIRSKLLLAADSQKQKAERMWRRILDLIGGC